jgi:hypothetical protein
MEEAVAFQLVLVVDRSNSLLQRLQTRSFPVVPLKVSEKVAPRKLVLTKWALDGAACLLRWEFWRQLLI